MIASRDGSEAKDRFFLVGENVIDAERNLILRNGELIKVEPKVMEVLVYLAAANGRIVPRQELMDKVWGVLVVDEAVQRAISLLRTALGSDDRPVPILETIRGQGYRLTVAATALEAPSMRTPARRNFWLYMAAAFLAGILATIIVDSLIGREAVAPPAPAGPAAERTPSEAPLAPR